MLERVFIPTFKNYKFTKFSTSLVFAADKVTLLGTLLGFLQQNVTQVTQQGSRN